MWGRLRTLRFCTYLPRRQLLTRKARILLDPLAGLGWDFRIAEQAFTGGERISVALGPIGIDGVFVQHTVIVHPIVHEKAVRRRFDPQRTLREFKSFLESLVLSAEARCVVQRLGSARDNAIGLKITLDDVVRVVAELRLYICGSVEANKYFLVPKAKFCAFLIAHQRFLFFARIEIALREIKFVPRQQERIGFGLQSIFNNQSIASIPLRRLMFAVALLPRS